VTRTRAVRALIVVLCAAGMVAAAVAYRSERRLDEVKRLALVTVRAGADDAERDEARRRALDLVPGAKRLNPDSAVDVQVALFLEPDNRAAGRMLERLTRREPENIFLWLLLTRKRQREGDLAAARRSYARASELDSRLPAD